MFVTHLRKALLLVGFVEKFTWLNPQNVDANFLSFTGGVVATNNAG